MPELGSPSVKKEHLNKIVGEGGSRTPGKYFQKQFNKYDISYQAGQAARSKSYSNQQHSYSPSKDSLSKSKTKNFLPKLPQHSQPNPMMVKALKQLYVNTQLLKRVYGIPDMNLIFQLPHEGALYIGNFFAATNVDELHQYKIGAVLTVAQQLPVSYEPQHNINHLVIQALDADFQNLSQFFEQTNAFIHQNLTARKNLLVHCAAGISRSSTCSIAYIMTYHKKSLDQALLLCRNQRKIVNPNPGFIKQLKQYETYLKMKRNKAQ